jgi:hypothetical protein
VIKADSTMLGFGLVALTLGVGLLLINTTIRQQVSQVNRSIQNLPTDLLKAVTPVVSGFGR